MQDPNFSDPRLLGDFDEQLYPRCDGRFAPAPDTDDRIEKRMLEFAAAYYRINQCHERLKRARLDESDEPAETILEAAARAAQLRDAIEDKYEPEGFYAEAEIDGIRVVNLEFNHALKRAALSGEHLVEESSFSLSIPMPEEEAEVEDHLRRHLGRIFGLADLVPDDEEE